MAQIEIAMTVTTKIAPFAAFEGRVRLIPLRAIIEPRGRLIEIDHAAVPFRVRRTFIVDRVPAGLARGGHAHRECEQVLLCLQGRLHVRLMFNERHDEATLSDNGEALYIGAGIWSEQHYQADTRLLVLASQPFDPNSYLSDSSRQWLRPDRS